MIRSAETSAPRRAASIVFAVAMAAAVPCWVTPSSAADAPKSDAPKTDSPPPAENAVAKPAEPPAGPATPAPPPPSSEQAKPPAGTVPSAEDDGPNLKTLLLGGPARHRVEVPRLPAMSVRGYIHAKGRPPAALLEIKEINRVFVVREGAEIPIMVAGRVGPAARDLRADVIGAVGKSGAPGASAAPPARPADPKDQTQVILKVLHVSAEGVTVEAGVLSQTLIIR